MRRALEQSVAEVVRGLSIREPFNLRSTILLRCRSWDPGAARVRSDYRARLLAVLFSTGLFVTCAFAANEPASPRSEVASAIDIKIETSRSQPTVGSGLGIVAEMQNVSNASVYLKEKSVILALPPELQGPFATTSALWGLFPTEHTFTPVGQDDPFDGVLTLKPGAVYRAFWSSTPSSGPAQEGRLAFAGNMVNVVTSELNFIFFTPGDYKVSVVVAYWTRPELPARDYRTVSQTATIRVAAPQTVILFGAGLGGLIAYFIMRLRRPTPLRADGVFLIVKMLLREGTGMAGAILLSAMVTILLARISETQFLIRITVNDFWGAIAIGFIASWTGGKVIEKFLPADASRNQPNLESAPEPSPPGESGAAKPAPVEERQAKSTPKQGSIGGEVF